MSRSLVALPALALLLAGCGADPTPPSSAATAAQGADADPTGSATPGAEEDLGAAFPVTIAHK